MEAESQFARRLAESGCRVLVPALINREIKIHGREGWRAYARQPISNREFLFRPAFELGRQLIGYEIQKIMAAVDRFKNGDPAASVGVIGWGDGGLLSLYAGALDRRIDATGILGYFNSRQGIWREPFDREVLHLYAARLGIPERCGIEWFVGGHEINGRGTFEFLHRHLDRTGR